MDKKSPDVRYICRISGWDFKHLAVMGWFRPSLAISRSASYRGFNHLAVWGWFRHVSMEFGSTMSSFNHLAVRGWFRLQTHEPAWLCGKPGFEFLKNIYYVSFYHLYDIVKPHIISFHKIYAHLRSKGKFEQWSERSERNCSNFRRTAPKCYIISLNTVDFLFYPAA